MVKVALLIGVSEYEPGLNPLPAAVKDVEAMRQVLQHPEMGGFAEVKTLLNSDPLAMQEAIETLFSSRTKDDLVLLFFSGHGVKDDSGRLYFATQITRKNAKGELVKATAVPASFVHDIMSNSRSRRQVVILDCCFSGAFAEGLLAKDDGSVEIKNQLGGEGRVVLTSSTSTQYSFEQQGADLSIYTRYFVEGIKTGAADQDNDGVISVDELHEYAKGKVQQAAPAMKPEIYAVKEGYKICIAKAQIDDPRLRYRQEVERCASRGEISLIGRRILDDLRDSLGILPEEAAAIETEVLRPYQEYKRKLQRYEQALVAAMQREHPLSNYTRTELKRYQEILKLRDEDIAPIESRIISREESSSIYQDTPITEPIHLEPKDVGTANETSSAIESHPTTKSTPTESLIDELSSKQRVNNTRPSGSNPQSLFAKIAQTKNKLLAGGAILLIGLAGAGFQIYRQTTWRYAQLDNLLSAKKWKDADEETAQKMWEVAGRQKERMLRVEDFEKIPCEDLRTIDALWKKYSKENYGFTVQSRIWQSSDVNGDLGKFVARVGWGKLENNGSSFYYYLMDNIPFDLSQPAGHLPWAPTYYGGNNDTRKKYISRILDCEI